MPSEEPTALAAHMGTPRFLFQSGEILSPSVAAAAVSVELTEMIQLHREKSSKNSKQTFFFLPVCGPSAHFLWSFVSPRC